MSEYIKKEDAIESARALLFCYGSDNIPDEQLDGYAEEFMNDDNTIIEVVRCKDCMWGNNKTRSGKRYCELSDMYQVDDGFCNWGEKIK